jgi:hypothetical protein
MVAGIMSECRGPPKSNLTNSFIGPDAMHSHLVGSITLTETVTVSGEADTASEADSALVR